MHVLRVAAVLCLLISAGCADMGVVTSPTALPSPTTSIQPDGGTGDPEPRWPTEIHDLRADLIMPGPSEQYPAEVIASGFMSYDSYHARLTGRANVTGPNTQSYEFYPEEQHHFFGFYGNGMHAQWRMFVGGPCGNVLELNLLGQVWWMYSGDWPIDQNERAARLTKRQADCPEETPGGGVKEPGTGTTTYTCYTYTVDHYWYYPDTGTYEYRYSTEETWCEPSQS